MEGPFESPLARPGEPGLRFYSENHFFKIWSKRKKYIQMECPFKSPMDQPVGPGMA